MSANHPGDTAEGVVCRVRAQHHGRMTQPSPEHQTAAEDYQAWRDLQDVLEERDAEWWAEAQDTDENE